MVSRWHDMNNSGGVIVPRSAHEEEPISRLEEPIAIVEGTIPSGLHLDDQLPSYCFDIVLARMKRQSLPSLPSMYPGNYEAPLFVTWELPNQILRGCIGSLEKMALHPGLQTYAIKSAFEDCRFPPIKMDELSQLECKVSVLHSFEQANHVYDWEIGKHGIIINFRDDWGTYYNATYLPEIALEHGMSHEVAIRELCSKAGYHQVLTENFINSRISVTKYQSGRVKLHASQYLAKRGMNGFW